MWKSGRRSTRPDRREYTKIPSPSGGGLRWGRKPGQRRRWSDLGFHLLHSVRGFANHHTVVEFHNRLQVAEEQEGAQVNLKADHMAGQFREGQDLNAVQIMRLVLGHVAAVHSGIDRYLNGAPGSRRVLEQVDCDPASLALDVFSSALAEVNLHEDTSFRSVEGRRFRLRTPQKQRVYRLDAGGVDRPSLLQAQGRLPVEELKHGLAQALVGYVTQFLLVGV